MSRMFEMYLFGFASVWVAVALVTAAVGGFRHFKYNWDRASKREPLDYGWQSRADTELRRS